MVVQERKSKWSQVVLFEDCRHASFLRSVSDCSLSHVICSRDQDQKYFALVHSTYFLKCTKWECGVPRCTSHDSPNQVPDYQNPPTLQVPAQAPTCLSQPHQNRQGYLLNSRWLYAVKGSFLWKSPWGELTAQGKKKEKMGKWPKTIPRRRNICMQIDRWKFILPQ